ncbi:unnamed protein product [Moneuplotes crassus]|uniref:Peripheral subunit-binding (PSBD) domain-containing protein n=1 Tax=Euplotes crassus TaxID=5936 RepID=A0AAD2CVS1_EUPCR|nr:unnamed protein product [Moneuplotes crassus]
MWRLKSSFGIRQKISSYKRSITLSSVSERGIANMQGVPHEIVPNHHDYMLGALDIEQPISPAARIHLIRNRLYLKDIKATGKKGMLLKSDVMKYLRNPDKYGIKHSPPVKGKPDPSFVLSELEEDDQTIMVNDRRKQILSQSRSIPFFVFTDEYDFTDLLEFEKNEDYCKLSVMLKSISIALSFFPTMNSVINPDVDDDGYIHEYVLKKNHNIGLAYSLPEGLALPCIPDIQKHSLKEVEAQVNEFQTLNFSEDNSQTSTFTLYYNESGSKLFPNIIRPQTCAMALGKINKMPSVDSYGKIVPRDIASVSIACDHRIIDGSTCVQFSNIVKSIIENPLHIIAHMK